MYEFIISFLVGSLLVWLTWMAFFGMIEFIGYIQSIRYSKLAKREEDWKNIPIKYLDKEILEQHKANIIKEQGNRGKI